MIQSTSGLDKKGVKHMLVDSLGPAEVVMNAEDIDKAISQQNAAGGSDEEEEEEEDEEMSEEDAEEGEEEMSDGETEEEMSEEEEAVQVGWEFALWPIRQGYR